ncbi:MAG: type I-B CRISPR-associated protein Cas8b1/Cst1 [Thermoanaerobacteraceae bacterium]|nr:type I-B CRISPR-associated protein Cas8b1/Cst1 [Thermoanaerobacteraceae bacterium]
MTKPVTIYPSTWYYNACVQGFLEILAWGLGEDTVRSFLHNDGTVKIPAKVMEAVFSTRDVVMPEGYPCLDGGKVPDGVKELKRITWWWGKKSYEMEFGEGQDKEIDPKELLLKVIKTFFKKNGLYPNLINLGTYKEEKRVELLNNWFVRNLAAKNQLNCSFCGEKFVFDFQDSLYKSFFTRSVSRDLGSSPDKVPNFFWNGRPDVLMCQQCRSYLLCFHIVHKKGYFINSDSLKINWYLNSLIRNEIKTESYQKALFNAVPFNSQLRSTLGSWGLQSMEVIFVEKKIRKVEGKTRTEEVINYSSLSGRLAELFLNPTITSLLGKLHHQKVWDAVLQEKFEYLLTIIYKSLRVGLTGENRNEDPEAIITKGNKNDMMRIFALIRLFYEIRKYLKKKGGVFVSTLDLKEIRQAAKEGPFSLDDNSKKSLIFRLLELTRLNKKSEVYHLLMRTYVAKGKPFPYCLAHLFEVRDDELFKTGIYAYISGIKISEENNEEI